MGRGCYSLLTTLWGGRDGWMDGGRGRCNVDCVIFSLSHNYFTSSSKTSQHSVPHRRLNLVVHHITGSSGISQAHLKYCKTVASDSGLLPHILFMFRACHAQLQGVMECIVCVCVFAYVCVGVTL